MKERYGSIQQCIQEIFNVKQGASMSPIYVHNNIDVFKVLIIRILVVLERGYYTVITKWFHVLLLVYLSYSTLATLPIDRIYSSLNFYCLLMYGFLESENKAMLCYVIQHRGAHWCGGLHSSLFLSAILASYQLQICQFHKISVLPLICYVAPCIAFIKWRWRRSSLLRLTSQSISLIPVTAAEQWINNL